MTLLEEEVVSARPATTPTDAWRAARVPVVIGMLVVGVAIAIAVSTGRLRGGALDPDSVSPPGAKALATLLADRGVSVERRAFFSGRGGTLFVPVPELLDPDDLRNVGQVSPPADIVIVAPDDEMLEFLGVDVESTGRTRVRNVEPACELPAARTAGVVRLGGVTYDASAPVAACYPTGGRASLLVVERRGVRITVVGTADLFTNDRLDEQGNAALALGLLSHHDRVEWLLPRLSELGLSAEEEGTDPFALLPRGVRFAVAQLFVVAVLLALWRGRRLGPVVAEPLPVVVRAAEAVEGRARLYQAARARDRAAATLRAARRDRLAKLLGLGPDTGRDAVVPVVAARADRPAPAVDLLLYGPPPADDAALVRLAAELDSLDDEVRRS